MAKVSLLEIRKRAKELADMTNSNFINDENWDSWINEGAAMLYDMQVGAYGNDYFVADPVTFSTVSGQDAYDFESVGIDDFYKLVGVSILFSGNNAKPLRKFNFNERSRGQTPFAWSDSTYRGIRYRLRGDKLWLRPSPIGTYQIEVWYVPSMPKMVDDTDTFQAQNHWESYIVNYAARKALIKEESDVSEIERDMQKVERHVESMAENRDIGEENQATDIYAGDGFDDYSDMY